MFLEILQSGDALSRILDRDYQQSWGDLYNKCDWATGFQSFDYVKTWYETQQEKYSPILIQAMDKEGRLIAIFPMALERSSSFLVGAGHHPAEYHSWICDRGDSALFASEAFRAIGKELNYKKIELCYLPPNIPLDFLTSETSEKLELVNRSVLLEAPRPIRNNAEHPPQEVLNGKNTRIKVNRLKRIGDLSFRVLNGSEGFDEFYKQLSTMASLRHQAVHGVVGSSTDQSRIDFYKKLLNSSGILHASGLWIGKELVAGHLGVVDRGVLHLGIIAHSPFLSKHSPGKVHLLMLADHLKSLGVEILDLTPGGDSYKESLATEHDMAYKLTIFPTIQDAIIFKSKDKIINIGANTLRWLNISPSRVKQLIKKIKFINPTMLISRLRRMAKFIYSNDEYLWYQLPAEEIHKVSETHGFSKNSLSDLLCYRPYEVWQTKAGFLQEALGRLGNGGSVHTFQENGRLLHIGWMKSDVKKSVATEVQQMIDFPLGTAVLYDFYTFPEARGRRLYQENLLSMMSDAVHSSGASVLGIGVTHDNHPSRHVIEKCGFKLVKILKSRTLLGKVKALR